MKKTILLSLAALAFVTFSCKKINHWKEKRVAKKLEGKWEVDEYKTRVSGKDSTYAFDKVGMQYIFNACENPDTLRPCSGSMYLIYNKDTAYQNVYTPFAVRYVDKENIKITMDKVTKLYKIEEYKKDELSLKELNAADNSEIGSLHAKRIDD